MPFKILKEIQHYQDNITWAENVFKPLLINRLIKEGIVCEIGHNQYIPIGINSNEKEQFKGLLDTKRSVVGYQLIRPDFILLQFCLCIEIDGLVHDQCTEKFLKDDLKERLLSKIGLDILRVPNEALSEFLRGDTREINRLLNLIVSLIRASERQSKTQRNRVKRNISNFRKKFSDFDRKILTKNESIHSYPALKQIKSSRKYGGYAYWT